MATSNITLYAWDFEEEKPEVGVTAFDKTNQIATVGIMAGNTAVNLVSSDPDFYARVESAAREAREALEREASKRDIVQLAS